MNKGLVARLQLMGSYGFLVSLLVIVVFPFYWMTVTSFKGEDQMRSLVSMFWPSPVVTDNYRHLLGKTEFVSWFGNSVIVSVIREIDVRQRCSSRYKIAEMNVPAWPIPTQKTKFVMSKAHPTLLLRPHTPIPVAI